MKIAALLPWGQCDARPCRGPFPGSSRQHIPPTLQHHLARRDKLLDRPGLLPGRDGKLELEQGVIAPGNTMTGFPGLFLKLVSRAIKLKREVQRKLSPTLGERMNNELEPVVESAKAIQEVSKIGTEAVQTIRGTGQFLLPCLLAPLPNYLALLRTKFIMSGQKGKCATKQP